MDMVELRGVVDDEQPAKEATTNAAATSAARCMPASWVAGAIH
ncbi:hypothetical protein AKJ09_00228 [Labilithrix luteola]|uniref:Uncharacterized protein n=1 Tax=Labilithrix luteola TaxID=1391654 RepID=A0A0K1PKC8_9BACT|nr:hypothetical protein AKJ09_00228 [Labilithrix luteola]